MNYEELTHTRHVELDGVSEWTWIKEDHGLWQGPSEEWLVFKQYYQRFIPKHDIAVQAGGACGMYPKLLSKIFSQVYTFEPDPLSFYCLVNNCTEENITKFNTAVGKEHRMVAMARNSFTNAGMHRVDFGSDTARVPMLLIDDLVLPACDLIHLDIEGCEYDALLGAERTISTFKPMIITENANLPIARFLEQWGYRQKENHNADTIWTVP